MKFHPLSELFPLMQGREFDELVADIKANGLREPIWTHQGEILDGRNRWRACEAAALAHRPMRKYTGDDPVSFVVSLNLHRRHLDESQRSIVASKLKEVGSANLHSGDSTAAVADTLNVSRRSVFHADKVRYEGTPELVTAVESGRVSVSAAADVSELPKEQQRQIVAKGEKEILEAAKQIRQQRVDANREQRASEKAAASALSIPSGKYRTIVIDPPWEMEKIVRDNRPNPVNFGFEYPTMSESELAAFSVGEMAHDDCHLFCWTTQKHLPSALRLVDLWGFRYVLCMVWHKSGGFQPYNLPQFNCEFVVYARRGSPEFVDTKAFSTCFEGQRREHSRKPNEFYDLISRVAAGPRIDVFSRESRNGFDQFGNETEKFVA